jgi:hypothetical protein
MRPTHERIDTPPTGGDCIGKDVKMWFPHAERSKGRDFSVQYRKANEQTNLAKAICSDCKQIDPCVNYALYHEIFGIWGGTTERERKLLRKRHNILMVQREPFDPVIPRLRDAR